MGGALLRAAGAEAARRKKRNSSGRQHTQARGTLGDMIMSFRHGITRLLLVAVLMLSWASSLGAQGKAAGEMVIAWHVTLAPAWFDPSTAPPQITPFGVLYAIHDALIRPLPGEKMGNSLAES